MAIKKLQEVEGTTPWQKQHWPSWPFCLFYMRLPGVKTKRYPGYVPQDRWGLWIYDDLCMCFLPRRTEKNTSGNSLVNFSTHPWGITRADECNQLRIVSLGLSPILKDTNDHQGSKNHFLLLTLRTSNVTMENRENQWRLSWKNPSLDGQRLSCDFLSLQNHQKHQEIPAAWRQ